ncbi:Methylosome protein 50 [Camponotus floridanus]|uniref:Methylosome protein 50 n=1 Tax=Camponotus floridanus TaxID=104421 RepID=E2A3F4_CAMFO|nr:Methylosome protein 50 [Camponotus floridanus]
MENWNIPNINGDTFRNMLFSDRSSVVNKNLQFLLIYDEHNALLGGTNMNDLYWTGTIWHYNDISDFTRNKAAITQQMNNGICDAVYLGHNKFVVVEDSGAVQITEIVQLTNEQSEFQFLERACQHDDSILTVSGFSNKRNIVTGGMDCCLKVWDIEDLVATYSYNFAHTDIITSTDVKPMCSSEFISTSLDGIFKRHDCHLLAVTWNTVSDHLIAVGAADGSIALIDVRQTENPLYESVEFNRGIHKLLFNPNPERKEQLACCSDDTFVKVFDTYREMLPIFENNSHSDFVQGLAWYKDDLFSCSWDGSVIKHVVCSSDNNSS